MRGKSFPIFGSGQNLENVNNQKFQSALLLIFVEKVEAVFHTVEKYVQNNSASQWCVLYRLRSALAYIWRF